MKNICNLFLQCLYMQCYLKFIPGNVKPETWHWKPDTCYLRHLQPVNWHLEPDACYLTPGSWHLIPCTWHLHSGPALFLLCLISSKFVGLIQILSANFLSELGGFCWDCLVKGYELSGN